MSTRILIECRNSTRLSLRAVFSLSDSCRNEYCRGNCESFPRLGPSPNRGGFLRVRDIDPLLWPNLASAIPPGEVRTRKSRQFVKFCMVKLPTESS